MICQRKAQNKVLLYDRIISSINEKFIELSSNFAPLSIKSLQLKSDLEWEMIHYSDVTPAGTFVTKFNL